MPAFFLVVFLPNLIWGQASPQALQTVLEEIYAANPSALGLMMHIEAPDQGISQSFSTGVSKQGTKTTLEKDQPVSIASTTKTYTSSSILRLIEEGEMTLDQPIGKLLSKKTRKLLKKDGYNLKKIQLKHLMTHTSGIEDYIDDAYMESLQTDPKHRWTRDEQIARTVTIGSKLGEPGEQFSYADVNFLLLTEIIEEATNKPFYTAMRELLRYEENGLSQTWFQTLESSPAMAKPAAHQYFGEMGLDSYELDPSFDLYGAGGIMATTEDMARFFHALFNGKVIRNPKVFDLIYTPATIASGEDLHYHLGLSSSEVKGQQAFGHGGFWGTVVLHFPDLNATISVSVNQRDQNKLRKNILEGAVELLVEGAGN